jgi:cell division protein FtsQ
MTKDENRIRSLTWEDDAPAEPRLRRVEPKYAFSSEAALPGLPREMDDLGEDDAPVRPVRQRVSRPRKPQRNPWWRPASSVGRFFLLFAVLAVLGGLGASAYILKTYLDRDARFRISGTGNIDVSGLSEVSRAEMLPVFGEDIGRNIFFVPLSERRKQLEQIPWIEKATVMRLLPNQIRVTVVERQPVAFTRMNSQVGLVDANGVLLTMPAAMMAQHHYSFPVVTGINPDDPPAARQARMAVYQRLLAELDSNGQHLSAQISEIDLTDASDARVLMPEQGADILAHYGEDHFLERYQRYRQHIAEWRQQYPSLAAVDLRYDQKVVLQMAPATNAAQAADGEQEAASAEQDKPATAAKAAAEKPASAEKKAAGKPVLTAHAATNKAAAGKKAAMGKTVAKAGVTTGKPSSTERKAKPVKAAGKASGKTSAKAKTPLKAALKNTSDKKGQKRAEVKKAAFNSSRRPEASRLKTAPATRAAEFSGMGQ